MREEIHSLRSLASRINSGDALGTHDAAMLRKVADLLDIMHPPVAPPKADTHESLPMLHQLEWFKNSEGTSHVGRVLADAAISEIKMLHERISHPSHRSSRDMIKELYDSEG
jgi:hypothetical protein